MSARNNRLFRVLKLAAIAAIIAAVVRRLRGGNPPAATGQAKWQPLNDDRETETRSGPVQFTSPPEDSPVPDPAPEGQTWVAPIDGACPESHPIKGNAGSGIFHVPGGMSYERTVPERCYATEADAEADGFRRAKR